MRDLGEAWWEEVRSLVDASEEKGPSLGSGASKEGVALLLPRGFCIAMTPKLWNQLPWTETFATVRQNKSFLLHIYYLGYFATVTEN